MPEFTIHLDDPQDAIANLRQAGGIGLAAQIERQLPKSSVEEPTEWGSVVRAFVCGQDPRLWVRTLSDYSGWANDTGATVVWQRLCEPEVLRVGVGEAAPEPTPEQVEAEPVCEFCGGLLTVGLECRPKEPTS